MGEDKQTSAPSMGSVASEKRPIEIGYIDPISETDLDDKVTPVDSRGEKPFTIDKSTVVATHTDTEKDDASPRRFLAAYIVSILSGLSLLSSGALLGYVVLNHFIAPKNSGGLLYIDWAPLYLSVMSSAVVFAVLYLVASQYVARLAAHDEIGIKDWRVYKVVYSSFTAVLFTIAASVIASFVYIPLAILFVAEDLMSWQITTQLLGGLLVLVWVGLLIWQERLVKHGKRVRLQGVFVTAFALVLVILTGIFPVGSKTDERFDSRASSDLLHINSAIQNYQRDHKNELPASLTNLDFEKTDGVTKRLTNYSYKVEKTALPASHMRQTYLPSNNGEATENAEDRVARLELSYALSREQSVKRYQLCTTFKTDTTKNTSDVSPLLAGLSGGTSDSEASFTNHKTGNICFDRH